ncbi:hypothetical protein GLOIN_2v1705704 [Rhizophagus clarus]|uniref:Uncharacterized protein n=1 Tax=Rhizophagus clarus TaxID=94130 RepID=A0A8H3M163_9GLOM|nr:hypothetical protein GLOIN_2v1705704 [Rhizophagus clarus]
MEMIKCKCVECTTSRVMDGAFKRDLQHLVLTLCRILFNNIQEKMTFRNSQSISLKITVSFINSSSKIAFNYQWDFKDQESNLNHLIEISQIYYHSFLSFFYKIDRWRRLSLKSLTNSTILSRIEHFMPGFKYLYDFHWITNSLDLPGDSFDSSNFISLNFLSTEYDPNVFFLASDFGVCVVVIVKNYYQDSDLDVEYFDLVSNYKKYATERHENKLITVIGATFNEDPNCIYPIEFADETDRSIARAVQSCSNSTSTSTTLSIYQAPRQEPAKTYEPNKEIYGQSWDHHPELTQKGSTQLMKMPLNPGKSAPIVGADWAYYHQNNDFEQNIYFNSRDYNNYDPYYDYIYQNYN